MLVVQVFVDTSGWAFTYPLARLAGARVAAYTHYPTVRDSRLKACNYDAPSIKHVEALFIIPVNLTVHIE